MAFLVVLASYTCSCAIMRVEQRLHLAFRFILDALIGLERGLAALATGERNRSQLDDLEFTFVHFDAQTNSSRRPMEQRGDHPQQEQGNASQWLRTIMKINGLRVYGYREIASYIFGSGIFTMRCQRLQFFLSANRGRPCPAAVPAHRRSRTAVRCPPGCHAAGPAPSAPPAASPRSAPAFSWRQRNCL